MQTIIQNRKQRCKICERPRKREKLERTTDAPKTNISKPSPQKLKLKNQDSHGCSKICITHLPIKDGNFTLGASLTKSLKSQSNSLSASKGINKIAVVTQGNSYTYHNVGELRKFQAKVLEISQNKKEGRRKKVNNVLLFMQGTQERQTQCQKLEHNLPILIRVFDFCSFH